MNRLAAALALALGVALAGCGVPSSGRPVVVGPAPRNGAPSSSNLTEKPTAEDAINAQDLVRRYLKAVAWGNEVSQDQPDALRKAVDVAKSFLTADAQRTWQPGKEIDVWRTQVGLPTATANGTRVDVAMQPIGALESDGTIEPRPALSPRTWQFTVVPAEQGNGLRIADPPPGMVLSDEGLNSLYDLQPIYFWDPKERNLVPDLRYIRQSVDPANRLVQLVNWLRNGPSDFLRQTVTPMPSAIEIKDRPVLEGTPPNAGVRVNLSAKAASAQSELPKFMVQLKWSLRPLTGPVELQIEGQRQDLKMPAEAIADNPAVLPDGQKDPPRFCVVDGKVRQLGGDPVDMPALVADDNSGVASAAILRGSKPQLALARDDGSGKVRLWLGSYDQKPAVARYNRTDLVASTMSRPVGLLTPDPLFLVPADGRLYAVPVGGPPMDKTPQGVGAVTSVSVAPDGRRIAFVAGGRAYVSVLQLEGAVAIGQPLEVQAGLSEAVGIAWSREEWVVVAGRSAGQSALVEVTIDSALVEPLQLRNLAGQAVTRVVADPAVRPDDPPRGEPGLVLVEVNGHTYRVFSSGSMVEQNPEAPSPLPSGAKPPPATAPFFLD